MNTTRKPKNHLNRRADSCIENLFDHLDRFAVIFIDCSSLPHSSKKRTMRRMGYDDSTMFHRCHSVVAPTAWAVSSLNSGSPEEKWSIIAAKISGLSNSLRFPSMNITQEWYGHRRNQKSEVLPSSNATAHGDGNVYSHWEQFHDS